MAIAYAESPLRSPHPVAFDIEYPERLSRLTTFFRLILAIPQILAVWLLSLAVGILTVLAWFAILFTGRYPKAFFEFTSGVLRWQANVVAYAALLRDEYPPFSWEPGAYPLTLDIPYPERQSRFRLFVRLITIIPNQIVLSLVQIGWYFTTFIAWFAILLTGHYPRGLFKFAVGVHRWAFRQSAYLYLLRDEYPPYSLRAEARPGNEVVSGIIGAPLSAIYIAYQVFVFAGAFTGSGDVTVSRTVLESRRALAANEPHVKAGGLRLTLLEYEEDADPPTALAAPGNHFVSFTIRAEKRGVLPAFYWPMLFVADDCTGTPEATHGLDTDASGFPFRFFFRGESEESTLYFQVPDGRRVCQLSYFTFRGPARFRFTDTSSDSSSDVTPRVRYLRSDLTTATVRRLTPTAHGSGISLKITTYASALQDQTFTLEVKRDPDSGVEFDPRSFVLTGCSNRTYLPSPPDGFDSSLYKSTGAALVRLNFSVTVGDIPCALTYRTTDDSVIQFLFVVDD